MTHLKRLLFSKRARRRALRCADDPTEAPKTFVQALTRMHTRGPAASAISAEKA
jgi:hypothetical protein